MKQRPRLNFHRLVPLLVAATVLGGSVSTASAIGKNHKPWQRSNSSESVTPKKQRTGLFNRKKSASTANVATSTTTKKRARLFSSRRDNQPKPVASTSTRTTTQAQRVSVRATATAAPPKPTKKKRVNLLARIFKPEPLGERSTTGNVAVARKKSGPVAPNPVQAPPRYNHTLLAQAKSRGSSVVVNIAQQRARLYVGGEVALDTPVSTARSGKHTPRGSFGVGQRVRTGKISTIYKVEMPYWMRLGQSPYGLHAGYLPGYPASAGCIRMPYQAAQKMFDATGYGTRVRITSG